VTCAALSPRTLGALRPEIPGAVVSGPGFAALYCREEGSSQRCRWWRACGIRGRRAWMPGGSGVAVQNCLGEGASCRDRVSFTSSGPWNGSLRGPLRMACPMCLPGELLPAKPLLVHALMAASSPLSGRCWPRRTLAWAAFRAGPAGVAGGWTGPPGWIRRPSSGMFGPHLTGRAGSMLAASPVWPTLGGSVLC
jgi:hypothetical protein